MKKRLLGSSNLAVSAIGLGCMGMSDFYGKSADKDSVRLLRQAVDWGINFFDTADMYGVGHNEWLVGQALRDLRDKVVIATKFGNMRRVDGAMLGVNGRPEYVKAACEMSLKRLGIDVIDLYYQHRVDPQTPIEETVGAMAELVKEGKVRFLGLSEAGADTIRRAQAVHPIAAKNTTLVEKLQGIAETKKCKPGQLALAWVLARGDDIIPIPGTRHAEYLRENIAACDITLSRSELDELDRIFQPQAVYGTRYNEAGMRRVGI
ncbi:MAG: aldo/keto reductase [Spirochaetia bacterium]